MADRTLGEEISDLCGSGHAGIWVQTLEPSEAIQEIYAAVHSDILPAIAFWKTTTGCLLHWYGDAGGNVFALNTQLETVAGTDGDRPVEESSAWYKVPGTEGANFAALFTALELFSWNAMGGEQQQGAHARSVVILQNIDTYLGMPLVVQMLSDHIEKARTQLQQRVIVLSSEVNIPSTLSRAFRVVQHPMPTEEELGRILNEVIEDESDLPEEGPAQVLEAAAGLTRAEAENAFALSLYRYNAVVPSVVFEEKAAELKKNQIGLSLYRGTETFADVGGLSYLKEFATAILANRQTNPKLRPRGIILAGVSGTGKSLFAKALGNEMRRPTLMWDLAQTLSQWQGVSGQNMSRCFHMAEAMAPCVLFLD